MSAEYGSSHVRGIPSDFRGLVVRRLRSGCALFAICSIISVVFMQVIIAKLHLFCVSRLLHIGFLYWCRFTT